MKPEIDKQAATIREYANEKFTDYQALRYGEITSAYGLTFIVWMTYSFKNSLEKILPDSFWSLAPFPLGLLVYYWMYRRMKKFSRYCSYFEARIGAEPLKTEEIT
jgi:hypothetical protein